jgi:hypothetical protein
MATKVKKSATPKKSAPSSPGSSAPNPTSGFDSIANSLDPLRIDGFDDLTNSLNSISFELAELSKAADFQLLIAHGSDADRERIIEYLKRKHYAVLEDR